MLVHYSTDYVFDGKKAETYTESDAPNPLSVYGHSKLEGERGIANCRRHLIFRTSWVIGAHGHNFLKTMLRLAAERESLRVVCDQHGAPASAAFLADVTAAIAAVLLKADADDPRWGLYHLVPQGETSWHGLACHILARARASGPPLKAGPGDVLPIPASEYPTPARRPQNSRLDTHKIRSTFDITLPDWRDGVDAIMDVLMAQAQHDHV
jgi:dTDP-4-dehydrorhamnose reductase